MHARAVLIVYVAIAALVAGCAAAPRSGSPARVAGAGPGGSCNAAAAQFAIARIADDALAEQAQASAGAQRVRIVRADDEPAPQQQLDPGRLTLLVGSHERVRAVRCD